MKIITLIFFAFCLSTSTWAYDFMLDNIYYKITSTVSPYTVAVTYELSNNTKSYTGQITIPPSITYNDITYSVTSIAGGAFSNCSGLTSIIIPSTVTSIEKSGAFYGCTGLKTITLPSSITSIGSSAFTGCTGLTSLIIPTSVTSIESLAFKNCTGLKSITIPSSVTSIGTVIFVGCTNLTSLIVDDANKNYTSEDGVLFDKNKLNLIFCLNSKTGSYSIPLSVISIGQNAFASCSNLTSIEIPISVTSIGYQAFAGCSGLTNINIPKSVTQIYDIAFSSCSKLKSIFVDNENPKFISIDGVLFNKTDSILMRYPIAKDAINYDIPAFVNSIDYSSFDSCVNLNSITITRSIKFINTYAFRNCSSLKSIYSYLTSPIMLSSSFLNVNKSTCILYVPTGTRSSYLAATEWKDFQNIIEFTTSLHSVNKSDINIYTENNKLIIKNAIIGNKFCIYTISGYKAIEKTIESFNTEISLPKGQYILRIGNYSEKVVIF